MKAFSAKRDQAVADEFHAEHGKCHKCGAWTPNDTLASLGAQCSGCFEAYCAEANTGRPAPRTRDERKAVLQRLARSTGGITGNQAATVLQRLREAEASGRQLTASQRWVAACCAAKLAGRSRPASEAQTVEADNEVPA